MNGTPADKILVYVQLGEHMVSLGLHAWQGIRDMLDLSDPALAARVQQIDREIGDRIARARAAAGGEVPTPPPAGSQADGDPDPGDVTP